jgi:hypothetical protein
MAEFGKQALYWLPRSLGVILPLFLALFALDAIRPDQRLFGNILSLAIHLLPGAILVATVVIAWRRERLGAAIYGALALWYVLLAARRASLLSLLVIAGPVLLAGLLFLLDWLVRVRPDKA